MKKQRTKSYNPIKYKQLKIERLLRTYIVCFVLGKNSNHAFLYDLDEDEVIYSPPESIAAALIKVRYKWIMHMAVFGRKPNGVEYMECQVLSSPTPYYQHELLPIYEEKHQELVAGFNKDRILTAGWLASVSGVELSEQRMCEIFSTLGAWDFEKNEPTTQQ